jgi:hypothetical protein
MANPEHLEVARRGAAAIAVWQRRNPGASLDLGGADLSEANLLEADLSIADLAGADLSGANLSGADLTWADLTGADVRRANLTDTNLTGADLTGAYLTGAYLTDANLTGADLTATHMTMAHLLRANLTEANLTKADLGGANLSYAELAGANLDEAHLMGTSLGYADLSKAAGLGSVNHKGPSSIGVDTLILSFRGAGNRFTPDLEAFFLGAGVPKELLAELPRIVAEVKYYSCFVCYGQPDLDFATRLCDDLERRGVPCWLYALDATPGERTWGEIGRKRREADKMVVICSAKALIRPGVLKEIEEQIDEDPEKMVPISRDSLWREPGFRVMRGTNDLKLFLLAKNYADFSDESHYEESLQRLLKALRRKAD